MMNAEFNETFRRRTKDFAVRTLTFLADTILAQKFKVPIRVREVSHFCRSNFRAFVERLKFKK
jgi:hypothetical protein